MSNNTLITFLGSNPLVPVIFLKHFPMPYDHVFLISTESTKRYAQPVKSWYKENKLNNHLKHVIIDPYQIDDNIERLAVQVKLDSVSGTVYLDCTGGTKQMVLSLLSYLCFHTSDKTAFKLVYTRKRPDTFIISSFSPNSQVVQYPFVMDFSLREIIKLHREKFSIPQPQLSTIQEDIARLLGKKSGGITKIRKMKKELNRCYSNNKILSDNNLGHISISFKSIPELENYFKKLGYSDKINLLDLQGHMKTTDLKETCDWFRGFWLEDYVYMELLNNNNLKLQEIAKNITFYDPEFEIDVLFIKHGHLFALSCTTTTDFSPGGKATLKKKLFEVLVRAKQIGGWKTNLGLVCFSIQPSVLEKEVQDFLVDAEIPVFGLKSLPNLAEKIDKWVNRQIGRS